MLHRSTIFFAGSSICLAIALGLTVWHVIDASPNLGPQLTPSVLGAKTIPDIPLAVNSPTPTPTTVPFDATSALVLDDTDNSIVFQQNAFTRVPIASISKLMTAMVALDYGIQWNAPANINPDEYGPGGNLMLQPGESVTMRDLFNASLLGSANNATKAYVRQLNIPHDEFIQAMNRKAVEIGLEQTSFEEETGLNPHNVSTAYEVARLADYAFSHYPDISKATSQQEYTFTVTGTGRVHTIHNTNKLVAEQKLTVSGSKTGYLDEAHYCLVIKGAGTQNHRVAVILGSPSESAHFADIQRLLNI